MKPQNPTQRDPNQGEGDKASAHTYDDHAAAFVAEGKVPKAAADAREFVEKNPAEAARAERAGKRGPGPRISVDDLVAKGHSVIERVKHAVQSARTRIAARRGSK